MIRHIVYGDQFVLLARDDSGHVFLQFVVVRGFDQVLASFHGKDDVDIDLGIRVGHGAEDAAPDGACESNLDWFYKYVAPDGAR